jgi:hypothetical protein
MGTLMYTRMKLGYRRTVSRNSTCQTYLKIFKIYKKLTFARDVTAHFLASLVPISGVGPTRCIRIKVNWGLEISYITKRNSRSNVTVYGLFFTIGLYIGLYMYVPKMISDKCLDILTVYSIIPPIWQMHCSVVFCFWLLLYASIVLLPETNYLCLKLASQNIWV